ncbi:MAG: serine protease [Planctomycetaceae bacterium]|nr:serine protease [Planctomycetales bacterium]MCB9927726.1 serine protease [Planctomycetaceae bacterium]
MIHRRSRIGSTVLALVILSGCWANTARAVQSFANTIQTVQPRMVKIYGAGGIRGLEPYQSGFLISADGHILTAWSYVLDTDNIAVVLNDGRRFEAEMLGADPRIEIAVLKVDATELPFFSLDQSVDLNTGSRVLAFSNVFAVAAGNEPVSVLHGSVSANTKLSARRGAYATAYHGSAYILDAMTNNPGAAGGALTDRRGQLAGILGKELRNSLDNTWLNYAIPIPEIKTSVDEILAGNSRPISSEPDRRRPVESVSLASLGIVLIPNVVEKTPPYVDRILPKTPAAEAGIQPDDLILFVNERFVNSANVLRNELLYIDRIDEVRIVVQRQQQLIEVSLFVE